VQGTPRADGTHGDLWDESDSVDLTHKTHWSYKSHSTAAPKDPPERQAVNAPIMRLLTPGS
jgi:hypothetical protein